MEDTAGDDVEDMLGAVEFEGVAGIGATLETGNNIVFGSEDVDDFAFALVAPLES